jgi:hypothetical protein
LYSADGDAFAYRVALFFVCALACFLYVSLHLKQKEEEFAVYEPYCANYTNASELMLMEEQNLVVRLIFTH